MRLPPVSLFFVIAVPGLDPGINPAVYGNKPVDPRVKPGDDVKYELATLLSRQRIAAAGASSHRP